MIPALEIKELCKTYPNGVQALKNIDLTVKSGDFFALLGANGAGKSTTIGLITTLLVKTKGQIRIEGHDIESAPDLAKACVGVVPQELNLNIFETCEQILINQAGFFGIRRKIAKVCTKKLLLQLGLWEKRDTMVRHLSGGMKRRLMIARALVHGPKVLILDEPTAGVDIENRRKMWKFLINTNNQGTTIILTTHYLEEAETLCKNIAIIDKGQIVTNTSMQALLASKKQQTIIFNTLEPLEMPPELPPYQVTTLDPNTFELRLDNQVVLNEIFQSLSKQGINITSLRNKGNRLEDLFLDLIQNADE